MAYHSPNPDRTLTSLGNQVLALGEWSFRPEDGALVSKNDRMRLEPRVAKLLAVLTDRYPKIVSREELGTMVWQGRPVGNDALPRAVLKLRRALNDDARSPRYIETIPRRGYRLLVRPEPVGVPIQGVAHRNAASGRRLAVAAIILTLSVFGWVAHSFVAHPAAHAAADTVDRANNFYYLYSRVGNEAAGTYFQRTIDSHPKNAQAHAGLANVLIQRVIRWPSGDEISQLQQSLVAAAGSERVASTWSQETLARAEMHASKALEIKKDLPDGHKALGLIAALKGRFADADTHFESALRIDPNHWATHYNLGDLALIAKNPAEAIEHYSDSYRAMSRRYERSPQEVSTWQAEVGNTIAELHWHLGQDELARRWFEQVLADYPWNLDATASLARILFESGDERAARSLCDQFALRVGPRSDCESRIEG